MIAAFTLQVEEVLYRAASARGEGARVTDLPVLN